ncbi:MAG: sigma-E processing peptidase SpoIIGA [Clostridia bacterium]|nr:sigma-E processing peptidase SpoIIGA [Clostridia bacterium]
MKIVYVDLLFLSNLIPDYLLLRLTAALSGIYSKPYRTVLGALLGGCLSVPLYFMRAGPAFLLKLAFCALLCAVAFGFKRLAVSCTLFFASSFIFCGAVWALSLLNVCGAHVKNGAVYANISFPFLCVSCVFAYCVTRAAFGQGSGFSGEKRVEVTAFLNGRSVRFYALSDTGNALRHPFSNKRVIVAPKDICAELFAPDLRDAVLSRGDPSEAFEALSPRLRGRLSLIPFSTAGGDGLMLVLKPDVLSLDGKKRDEYLLGLANCGTDALIGV